MNPDYIEVVNYVQDFPPQEKRMIYSIYKEFIPKNNKWSKYIKSKVKQPNKDLVDHIKNYFECSNKESKEYINMLAPVEINRITRRRTPPSTQTTANRSGCAGRRRRTAASSPASGPRPVILGLCGIGT